MRCTQGDTMDTTKENEPTISSETEPEFVSAKAYRETNLDMHKFKAKLKETEALLNQLKAEKESSEREQLIASEQWKVLYEKEQKEKSEILSKRAQEQEQFISFHKKNAVLKEVGGFKRDEYTSFINVNSIEVDEAGNVLQESLIKEANRIKQAYPELLKGAVASNLPSEAPKSSAMVEQNYSMLKSREDKENFLREMILKEKNK
jgi:hypothetical protein